MTKRTQSIQKNVQEAEVGRQIAREILAERQAFYVNGTPVEWIHRLTGEAVATFVSLGITEVRARKEIEEEISTAGEPQVLVESVVAQQRVLKRMGLLPQLATHLNVPEKYS